MLSLTCVTSFITLFVSVSPSNLFPHPLALSHYPGFLHLHSTLTHLTSDLFLSVLPSFLALFHAPNRGWQHTAVGYVLQAASSSLTILSHVYAHTHVRVCIHTEEGLTTESFICLLYRSFKMESAFIHYAVHAMRNLYHNMARQLSLFFNFSFPQKAKLHAALQEKNRLNLELINHQLKASRYDQVSQ